MGRRALRAGARPRPPPPPRLSRSAAGDRRDHGDDVALRDGLRQRREGLVAREADRPENGTGPRHEGKVEKILRDQEQRCRDTLTTNRNGLDLVARALLEHETIDGSEVERLIGVAAGNPATNGSGEAVTVPEDRTEPQD